LVVQHERDLLAKLREANGEKYIAKKFIIAAGSTATVPPIENIREVGYITQVEALKLKAWFLINFLLISET